MPGFPATGFIPGAGRRADQGGLAWGGQTHDPVRRPPPATLVTESDDWVGLGSTPVAVTENNAQLLGGQFCISVAALHVDEWIEYDFWQISVPLLCMPRHTS